MSLRIFNSVPCATRFTIVDSYYSTASIDHPFVPVLKAVTAVTGAYELYQICLLHNGIVPRLPIRRPSAFKASIGRCRHKVDCRIGFTKPENNLCRRNVNTTSHAGYKGNEPIIHRLEDCCLQIFFLSAPLAHAVFPAGVQ